MFFLFPNNSGGSAALALYSDVPSSITSTSGSIAGWGVAKASTGAVQLTTDTVASGSVVRARSGDRLATPAGTAAFLSRAPSTVIAVWRATQYNFGGSYTMLDTTQGGTVPGYQIRVDDDNANPYMWRVLVVRVFDGSSWVVDAPVNLQWGHFVPLKWHVVVVRLKGTQYEVRVDGRAVNYIPTPVSFAYPAGGAGALSIGGGPQDFRCIEAYSTYLTDAKVAAREAALKARFNVDMLVTIGGFLTKDPPRPQPQFVGFPWVALLPDGRVSVTCFNGHTESPDPYNFVTEHFSTDKGLTFPAALVRTIYQGDETAQWADPHTLVMSNGQVLRTVYRYVGGMGADFWWQVSSDNGNTYTALQKVVISGVNDYQVATGGCPVEDPAHPGTIHWQSYVQVNASDAGWKLYDMKASSFGAGTWTRTLMLDGVATAQAYAEPQCIFHSSGEMRCLLRNDTDKMMYALRSTDSGATWSSISSSPVIVAVSAGQGYMEVSLPDGTKIEVWVAGRPTSYQQAAIYYRRAGAAWDEAFYAIPDSILWDARPGASAYGGGVVIDGRLYCVWGETTQNGPEQVSDVVGRYIDPWAIVRRMPGSVTPATSSIISARTQQLNVLGAGGFTYTLSPNYSTGTVSSTGLYTAGNVSGVQDVVLVTDGNGYRLGSASFTVLPDPNVRLDSVFPDAGSALGGTLLEVRGANYVSGSTKVTIGGVDVTNTMVYANAGSVTVRSPALGVLVGGYTVQVSSSNGTASRSQGYTAMDASLGRHYDPGASYSRRIVATNKVAALSNSLGTGDDLTQLQQANMPTYDAAGLNNMPALVNGSATLLVGSSTSWATTGLTLATVLRTTQTTEGRVLGQRYNGDHGMLQLESATGKLTYWTADSTVARSDQAINDGLPHAVVSTLLSGTAAVYVDSATPGATTAASTTSVAWNPNGDRNCFGGSAASQDGDVYLALNGTLGPAFVFTSGLTGNSLATLVDYLKRRGGVA